MMRDLLSKHADIKEKFGTNNRWLFKLENRLAYNDARGRRPARRRNSPANKQSWKFANAEEDRKLD